MILRFGLQVKYMPVLTYFSQPNSASSVCAYMMVLAWGVPLTSETQRTLGKPARKWW